MIASLVFVIPDLHELSGSPDSAIVRLVSDSLYAITTRGLPVFSLALACLMVSRIRYPHIVRQLIGARYKFRSLLTLVFTVVVVSAIHELAVPLVLCMYIIPPPVRAYPTHADDEVEATTIPERGSAILKQPCGIPGNLVPKHRFLVSFASSHPSFPRRRESRPLGERHWIPAFAGMTDNGPREFFRESRKALWLNLGLAAGRLTIPAGQPLAIAGDRPIGDCVGEHCRKPSPRRDSRPRAARATCMSLE